MPIVEYRASNFGVHWGPKLSGKNHIEISWDDIVWAAMSMGKPGLAFLFLHGRFSIHDMGIRVHTVYANLKCDSESILKSDLYCNLDPTEKGGISYFMGMMAAKIVASRLLDTPWAFNLSFLSQMGGVSTKWKYSEPDLIGLSDKKENG